MSVLSTFALSYECDKFNGDSTMIHLVGANMDSHNKVFIDCNLATFSNHFHAVAKACWINARFVQISLANT